MVDDIRLALDTARILLAAYQRRVLSSRSVIVETIVQAQHTIDLSRSLMVAADAAMADRGAAFTPRPRGGGRTVGNRTPHRTMTEMIAPAQNVAVAAKPKQHPCERCGHPAALEVRIGAFGDQPGYDIFRCDGCGAEEWVELILRSKASRAKAK
jgi:hypothetical protein